MSRARRKGENAVTGGDLGHCFRIIALHFGWQQSTYLSYLGSRPGYIAQRALRELVEE